MQKKIIALAVAGLMSGAAFAQSNVTISGLFDAGLINGKTQNNTASNNANYNGTSTSNVTIAATEDLGGGMKAGVLLESDIRGNNVGGNGLGGFQHYVWIGGNFGTVSLGQRTNLMTTTAVTVQPFGTAMGGGFAGASHGMQLNRLRGGGSDAYGAFVANTGRDVRPDGMVDYRSPSFSGFSFGAQYKPKNNDASESSPAGTYMGYVNVGANYNNGPLNLSIADTSYTNTGNALSGTAKTDHTMLGGNYAFGPATVYLGWSRSKTSNVAAPNNADARSWNVALKYAVSGNLSAAFNMERNDDKTAANDDRRQYALGLDYALSKRTGLYARNVWGDNDKADSTRGKFRLTTAGLKHSF